MEWLNASVFHFNIAIKTASQLQDTCRILKVSLFISLVSSKINKAPVSVVGILGSTKFIKVTPGGNLYLI
jgi:hypothetical protein